jgi:hypothetical protein
MRAPWWCCFGWSPRSLVCLLDNVAHALRGDRGDADELPGRLAWLCEAHDRLITGAAR